MSIVEVLKDTHIQLLIKNISFAVICWGAGIIIKAFFSSGITRRTTIHYDSKEIIRLHERVDSVEDTIHMLDEAIQDLNE